METTSTQKYIHTSPRKMRLVVDMVKKMHPVASLNVLRFTSKAAAKDLQSVINTAIGNAKQSGLDLGQIYFKAIEVNEGPVMKRFRPASKGRALPYKRRMSHVKIVLSDESKQLSVVSSQSSEKSEPVVSESVAGTDEPRTEKPKSDNRKPKTDNRKSKEKK